MTDKPRKTLAQMKAEATDDPWKCPKCGCKDWRVLDSYETGGKRRRVRCCRNCRKVIETFEAPCPPGFRVVVVPEDEKACA